MIKNTNKAIIISIFIALYFMVIYNKIYSYSQTEASNDTTYSSVAFSTGIISPKHMSEDLDYLVQKLKNVHPATYRGFNQQQQSSIDEAYKRILKPVPASEFFFIASSVIASLNDGHSLFAVDVSDRCIDMPIVSLNDGFYIREATEHFEKGDKILSLGNMTMDSIFLKLRNSISSENDQWRKALMELLIGGGHTMEYLDLIENDSVSITVSRNGDPVTAKTPLQSCKNISWWRHKTRDPFVAYKIYSDHSLGVLYIDRCVNDDYYRNTLRSFFSDVAENKIKNIVVDLRRNNGGDSSVIQEFLSYFNIDKYKIAGAEMRFSAEIKEAGVSKRQTGNIKKGSSNFSNKKLKKDPKLLFNGNLFVMTSAQTFSSANMFAMIIKDNRLGTIIGEPTGNAPSAFGETLSFKLPNSRFSFAVSYKKFTRSGHDNNPQDALYPDVPVYTTGRDLSLDIDPQLEKIKDIIGRKPSL